MEATWSRMALALTLAAVLAGCSSAAETGPGDMAQGNGGNDMATSGNDMAIVLGQINYLAALRSAALRLTGNYPTDTEIQEIATSPDRGAAYSARIDDYLSRPSFAAQQLSFWRNTFRMGAAGTVGTPPALMDFAPTFAAMLVVQGQPFTQLVTATSGTCPTFDSGTGQFTSADCASGNPVVGVLTDAGVQQQFYSSMAFRRVRWVQETLLCSRFPAEQGGKPTSYPAGVYNNPWPKNSITGHDSTANPPIDFQATTAFVCANCHATMNHIAPLFGKFDRTGTFVAGTAFQVQTPITPPRITLLSDWLPAGETTAWRMMKPTADLPALGAAIAADPGFARCMVTRVWNWAMSRGDVIDDGAVITDDLAGPLTSQFATDYDMKTLLRRVFTNNYFIRF